MSGLLDKLTGRHHDKNNDMNDNSSSSSSMHSSSSSSMHSGSSSNLASNPATSTTTTTTKTTESRMNNASGSSMYGSNTSGGSSLTVGNQQQYGTGYSGTGTNTDEAMTRSEERLRVGKETVNAGTAALDKYVTTEHVAKNVPVTKERVVIEREPVNQANAGAALSGADITEAHHEVHLKEERALAAKEVVPIERIRLAKQAETHQEQVGADLRKEHVDLTTTGINEKFDNVGYGVTTGQKMDPTESTSTTSTTTQRNAGVTSTGRTGQY